VFFSLHLKGIFYFLTAAIGQTILKLNTRDEFIPVTKVCVSCTKIRNLSNPSSIAVQSQLITAKRFAMSNCSINSAFTIVFFYLFIYLFFSIVIH